MTVTTPADAYQLMTERARAMWALGDFARAGAEQVPDGTLGSRARSPSRWRSPSRRTRAGANDTLHCPVNHTVKQLSTRDTTLASAMRNSRRLITIPSHEHFSLAAVRGIRGSSRRNERTGPVSCPPASPIEYAIACLRRNALQPRKSAACGRSEHSDGLPD